MRAVVATFPVHAQCGAPVNVVQTAEHGNRLDTAFGFARPWNGLLLGESLVRARLGAKADDLGRETSQVRLTQDQHVVV